ncbi:MAG TPA: hypothetical protein VGH81_12495 [Rudaea sp.]|jgi:hypothetical protein
MRNGKDVQDAGRILAKMQHHVKRNPSRNKVFESAEIPMNPAGLLHPSGTCFRVLVVKK